MQGMTAQELREIRRRLNKGKQAVYTLSAVESLISDYIAQGGELLTLEEGTLGYGLTVLYDWSGRLKFVVIREVYLNCWSSAHTIRMYREIPTKYKKQIEEFEYGESGELREF